MGAWFEVLGPKVMAAAAADNKRMNEAVVAAFNDPAVKENVARPENSINISTPEHAGAPFRRGLARYAQLAKRLALEAN